MYKWSYASNRICFNCFNGATPVMIIYYPRYWIMITPGFIDSDNRPQGTWHIRSTRRFGKMMITFVFLGFGYQRNQKPEKPLQACQLDIPWNQTNGGGCTLIRRIAWAGGVFRQYILPPSGRSNYHTLHFGGEDPYYVVHRLKLILSYV